MHYPDEPYIKYIECPIALFHGINDEIIYYKSSLKLKEFIKDSDRLFLIKGGHHNDLSSFESYHYHLGEILI